MLIINITEVDKFLKYQEFGANINKKNINFKVTVSHSRFAILIFSHQILNQRPQKPLNISSRTFGLQFRKLRNFQKNLGKLFS